MYINYNNYRFAKKVVVETTEHLNTINAMKFNRTDFFGLF